MSDDNHIYTREFLELSRDLSRKGHTRPGQEAMKLLGPERAVKKRYHDYYLDKKLQKR